MEIILGKTAGFCYGVKRAVDGAKEELSKTKDTLYCLGEIVHNQEVINELRNKGLKFIETIEEAKGKTIIRAHGVKKSVYEKAKKMQINLCDYTCPKVLKIHEIAEEYAQNGYYIFLSGSKTHPENIGTISFCGKNCSIIEKIEDVEKEINNFRKSHCKNLLLISQTTYNLDKFLEIENLIKNELQGEVIVKNTICKATQLRQLETKEIAKKVDCMIIIGGKNSSNTKKLYDIAKETCNNSICVETKEEIDMNNISKCEKIGVMAGASTPKESIEEVIKLLEERDKILIKT